MSHHNRLTGDKLAALLGMTRRRLYELRALEGAPATFSEKPWRKFLEKRHEAADAEDAARDGENGATGDNADGEAEPRPSTPALKAAKLTEEIRKLRLVNDIRDKRLKETWRQAGMDAAGSILRRVRGGLLGLLPARLAAACAGKTGSEIELIARREVEAVLTESLAAGTDPEPPA